MGHVRLLKKIGIDLGRIKAELERELKAQKTNQYDLSPVSQKVFKILDYAQSFDKRNRERK